MSQPATHVLFLDLETTGSDRETSDIIEVGVALTLATPELPIIAAYSTPVRLRSHSTVDDAMVDMTPQVVDMHTKNGLLDELRLGKGLPLWAADLAVKSIVQKYVPPNRKVPLGGSGVGHFDRGFVNRDFPTLAKRLTYWPLDIGVFRRMAMLAGVKLPKAHDRAKTHRALDCVEDAITEARFYFDLLVKAGGEVVVGPETP